MKMHLKKLLIKSLRDLKKYNFTKIAAIESRGFVFASAVSYILKKTIYNA